MKPVSLTKWAGFVFIVFLKLVLMIFFTLLLSLPSHDDL